MDEQEIEIKIKEIVKKAVEIKNRHISENNAQVVYVCIFTHSQQEFNEYIQIVHKKGKIIKETQPGPIFQIEPIKTIAGTIHLLKIRLPDESRPEKGYADFKTDNYDKLKKNIESKKEFRIIPREEYELIELLEENSNVRVYFSNPPFDEIIKV